MKKKLLILLLLLLLTGCKANYNLKINFGGNVIENGSIYLDSNLLGKGGNSADYKEYLDNLLREKKASIYRNKIMVKKSNYIGILFYHRYRTFNNYITETPATKLLYDYINQTNIDGYVKINSSSRSKINDYHNITGDLPTHVDGFEISISLPYKVIKTNATKINSETNTYTWLLTPGLADDSINLEYRESELYTNNPLYLMRFVNIYIYITGAMVIILLIISLIIKNKFRRINRL